MHDPQLADFNLVGGTALALYLGHRVSVDLDLFKPDDFDAINLKDYLMEKYDFKPDMYRPQNVLKGFIGKVVIDCITDRYPLIKPVYTSEVFVYAA
jgi:hypothetical protein